MNSIIWCWDSVSTSTCIWLYFLSGQLSFLHMLRNQVLNFTTDSSYHQGGTQLCSLKPTLKFLGKERGTEGSQDRQGLRQTAVQLWESLGQPTGELHGSLPQKGCIAQRATEELRAGQRRPRSPGSVLSLMAAVQKECSASSDMIDRSYHCCSWRLSPKCLPGFRFSLEEKSKWLRTL